MKSGTTFTSAVLAACLASALPAAGQESDPVMEFLEAASEPTVEPAQMRGRATSGKPRSSLGLKVEHWEPTLEVTDVDPIGLAPEDDWELETVHAGGLLVFAHQMQAGSNGRFGFHAGLGLERVVVTLERDPTDNEFFTRMDDSFVFEAGAGYTFLLDQADIRVFGDFRLGNAEWDNPDPTGDTETYEYSRIRFGAEVGLRTQTGARPFFGLRYSLYQAEYTIEQFGGGTDLVWEVEYDQPIGVSVGVDLEGDHVTGRMELMFVDDTAVGFLASLGYVF